MLPWGRARRRRFQEDVFWHPMMFDTKGRTDLWIMKIKSHRNQLKSMLLCCLWRSKSYDNYGILPKRCYPIHTTSSIFILLHMVPPCIKGCLTRLVSLALTKVITIHILSKVLLNSKQLNEGICSFPSSSFVTTHLCTPYMAHVRAFVWRFGKAALSFEAKLQTSLLRPFQSTSCS